MRKDIFRDRWPSVDHIPDGGPITKADCGSEGVGPGACGLYAAAGEVDLNAALEATKTMQARGTFGAGVLLQGIYPKRAHLYAFHVIYRNRDVRKQLEPLFTDQKLGMRPFGDPEPLATPEAYRKYDLPEMRRYFMAPPTEDEMLRRWHTNSENLFVRMVVEDFNREYMGAARIFSSGKNLGVFITAMQLEDTIEILDLYQYAEKPLSVIMIHMRWPTSIVSSGVWWGAHPINIINSAIVHNGDLSSSPSNRQGLEAESVARSVGTDSEAILLEVDDLLVKRGFSYQQAEWVMCQKFPKELETLDQSELAEYKRILSDPILARFKMSGPSSFVALVGKSIIAGRDRDGLRQLWMGRSEDGKTVIWGSEEKVIYQSAWLAKKNFKSVNCEPGRLIAYEMDDDRAIKGVYGETL